MDAQAHATSTTAPQETADPQPRDDYPSFHSTDRDTDAEDAEDAEDAVLAAQLAAELAIDEPLTEEETAVRPQFDIVNHARGGDALLGLYRNVLRLHSASSWRATSSSNRTVC